MDGKGIAASVIVVILVVAVAAVGAGVYILLGKQAGPGSEQEPGGGEIQQGQPDQPFDWVSDITPGSGAGTAPGGAGGDGPWKHRVMSATSSDGENWVKDDRIIADQASVPDAILDNDSNMRVYYVDWYNGHAISVALSHDGVNWIYKKVTIQGEVTGSQSGPSAVDPDIVLLPDGRYRLYYMYLGTIYSAISNYGINFVKETGVRFQEGGYTWMDPDVVKMGDNWRMFTWREVTTEPVVNQIISTVSSDGLSFTKETELTTVGNISCTIPAEGGYRMYYVSGGIYSAFSSDGVNWAGEGMRLSDAADPAVIKLSDGTYKMFYKVHIE